MSNKETQKENYIVHYPEGHLVEFARVRLPYLIKQEYLKPKIATCLKGSSQHKNR